MASADYISVDLGAETVRATKGAFDDTRLTLDEILRVENRPLALPDGLRSDVLGIFRAITNAITATHSAHARPRSIGVDGWGVDYALLDTRGALLGNPVHYRDSRHVEMWRTAFAKCPPHEIYQHTGAQFLPINTIFQLQSEAVSQQLELAAALLPIPDLIVYWLTGEKLCETSSASTTQLHDIRTRDWAWELLHALNLPHEIFPPVIQPGQDLGRIRAAISDEIGFTEAPRVVSVVANDTGSAVAAVPATSETFAFISSGTWSIVGAQLPAPIVAEHASLANLGNESSYGSSVRLMRSVMGMWLLQECRRAWARAGVDTSYAELAAGASTTPSGAVIDTDAPDFLHAGDMPERIRSYCLRTGQQPPDTRAAVVRCIFESLALKYRWLIDQIEQVSGQQIELVHIVGGGSQSELLCSLAATALRRPVLAGPVEATSIGNLLVQACADGVVGSVDEMRTVVRQSFPLVTYEPTGGADRLDEQYATFLAIASLVPSWLSEYPPWSTTRARSVMTRLGA